MKNINSYLDTKSGKESVNINGVGGDWRRLKHFKRHKKLYLNTFDEKKNGLTNLSLKASFKYL